MGTELFDVQCGFGGMAPGDPVLVTAEDVVEEMARLTITGALVRTAPEPGGSDVLALNASLFAARAEHPALLPCPAVIPTRGTDLPAEEEQLAMHLAGGCGAVCIRPSADSWSTAPWMSDALFGLLQERCLPVVCMESQVNLEAVGEVASRFPSLPLIAAGVTYTEQRVLLALLQSFPCVYLSIGSNYTVHWGLEELTAAIGPERLLFGTGFPRSEPMAAITQLMYANLSDDAKQLIGAANAKRLISEIRR
jgi:predicted TIM-barrel fold metal-dependent hydrolase